MTAALIVTTCVTGAVMLSMALYFVYWKGYYAGCQHVMDELRKGL